jgi:hypothetical protein
MESFNFWYRVDSDVVNGGNCSCSYQVAKINDKGFKEMTSFELASLKGKITQIINPDLAAQWTRKYINNLPDSCFAVVEPAYKSGKSDNKNARHLPYKDAGGKIDLDHLRNALARMNQIQPVTDSITTEELRAKAKKVLAKVAKANLPNTQFASINIEPLKGRSITDIANLIKEISDYEIGKIYTGGGE